VEAVFRPEFQSARLIAETDAANLCVGIL
jgi:hypothetical protein